MKPWIVMLVAFALWVVGISPSRAGETAWPDIQKAPFDGPVVVKKLPAPPSSMIPAAGGRFLVFRSQTQSTVVVFDLNEMKVHGTVPIRTQATLMAAGRSKLVLVEPATGVAERWSLQTLKKEMQTTLTVRLPVHGIALGAAAAGPLLVVPTTLMPNEPLAGMQLLNLRDFSSAVDGQIPNRYLFPNPSAQQFAPFASDDGSVFVCGLRPLTVRVVDQTASIARYPEQVYPGSFGNFFYGRRSPLNAESFPLTEVTGKVQSTVAACGGPLYMQLTTDDRGALVANVCEEGEWEAFGTVPLVSSDHVPRGRDLTFWNFNIELLPHSQVIANSSSSKSDLVLFRCDVEQMVKNSKVPVLTILSQPEPVRPGTEFQYAPRCLGGNEGATFALEFGPPGMSVSNSGVVKWTVPKTFTAADQTLVALRVRRGTKETFHRFHLELEDSEMPAS